MELPEEQKKKRKRTTLIVLCVVLSILLVLLLIAGAATYYVNHLLNQINYVGKDESTLSTEEAAHVQTEDLETIDPDESLPDISELESPDNSTESSDSAGSTSEPDSPKGDIVNILLIGQDRRSGEQRARSDSMILVTFNKSNNTITLTSFMRDSYVQIPGYANSKLNHAFQYGGMQLLNDTLYVNFGVEVDGDVSVDFSQFKNVIDLLGGVDISLTEKEANYLNEKYGWSLPSGLNRLDGNEALAYSRIRYIDNDYYRAGRQRKVLMSLLDRYKSLSVLDMLSTLEDVLGLVTTNMEKSQIISYATELFPMLSSGQMATQQIPAEGTFKGGNVQVRPGLKDWFQYNIDFATNREILREIFDAD